MSLSRKSLKICLAAKNALAWNPQTKRGDRRLNKGHENLIPLNERTKEEQRGIAQSGGIASGEARRRRKALKETMEALLSLPISDRRRFNNAAKLGFNVEDLDNGTLIVIALWERAISGDVPAIKELRALIDESGGDSGQLEKLLRGILDADIHP